MKLYSTERLVALGCVLDVLTERIAAESMEASDPSAEALASLRALAASMHRGAHLPADARMDYLRAATTDEQRRTVAKMIGAADPAFLQRIGVLLRSLRMVQALLRDMGTG